MEPADDVTVVHLQVDVPVGAVGEERDLDRLRILRLHRSGEPGGLYNPFNWELTIKMFPLQSYLFKSQQILHFH